MSGTTLLWLVLLKLSGIGILYLALSAAVVGRFARSSSPRLDVFPQAGGGDPAPPSVTILKPLHGAEPGLPDNLRSFLDQDHPGPVRLVCGVQSPADPAVAVVEALRAAHPDRRIALVVDGRLHGTNRKVSNLVNMSAGIDGDVVVLADSDIRVGRDYLRRLVAALDDPAVGAATCLYHGVPAAGTWSRLSGLGIDTHFLPGVVMGLALGLARPCMGSTVALRRGTLERVGGFRSLADALADDYELGAAVRRLGLRVVVPPFTVGHVCPERSAAELWRQELRWQRTIRLIDPPGHLGSVLGHPLAFALAALALVPGPVAAAVAFTAIAARVALCLAVERAFGLNPHRYWLIPARDLLSFAVFVASFLGRGVAWRGHRYDVARSGALIPKTRPDPS